MNANIRIASLSLVLFPLLLGDCRDPVESAGDWLVGQIHPETHLLRSYDNPAEFNAWTYDQAAGAIALLETRHDDEARALLNAMLAILSRDEVETGTTAFADGYVWDTSSELVGAGTRATGPNAWVALALLHGYRAFGDDEYLTGARDIASWLIDNLLITEGPLAGAFRGGLDPGDEPFDWVSSEHNADMLALLRGLEVVGAEPPPAGRDWRDYAGELERWMLRSTRRNGLWNDQGAHFEVGYENVQPPTLSTFNEVLDSQTWTLLAFDASSRVSGRPIRRNRVGLDWLDANWQVATPCEGRDRVGFSKRTFNFDGTPIQSYWAEGMAGYAVARQTVPPSTSSNPLPVHRVIRDLACFQQEDGGVLYSRGETVDLAAYFDGDEAPIAVFSSFNNLLGGEPNVFGDAQPDWKNRPTRLVSWFYSRAEVGDLFDEGNVLSPDQSFALVNDSDRSDRYPTYPGGPGWNPPQTAWNPHDWASFSLTLAPKETSKGPQLARDISGYDELRFWAKAAAPGVSLRVFVTDSTGDRLASGVYSVSEGWEQVQVALDSSAFDSAVDFEHVTAVGISFGNEVNGMTLNDDQATFWVDDFSFYPAGEPLPELKTFPDNWAWESIAATSWFIFAVDGVNPFAVDSRTHKRFP